MSTTRVERLFHAGEGRYSVLKIARFFRTRFKLSMRCRQVTTTGACSFVRRNFSASQTTPLTVNLCSSVEANFHLNGNVNRHSSRYCSSGNPRWAPERLVQSPKVVVWSGLWKQGVVRPFFFSGKVTGESYLEMLQQKFLPELEMQHMQKVSIFVHYRARPH